MTARYQDHVLGIDTHANRPAATAVPVGATYSCSTHSLIYKSDGSTWATWATLAGSASVPAGGTTGQVLAKNSATDYDTGWATASGSGWTNQVTLGLSTLTGWTTGTGTWTIASSVINQSDTTSTQRRLHLDTKVPLAQVVAEVDIKINTAASTTLSRGGFVFGTPASSDGGNGDGIFLATNGSTAQVAVIHTERDALSNYTDLTLAAPIANSTWITLRALKSGRDFTIWVNGTLVGTVEGSATTAALGRFALYSYAADVSFRNLDIWTPTMP